MITIPTPPSGTFGSYRAAPPKKNFWSYLIVVAIAVILAAGIYYFFFYKDIGLFSETPSAIAPAPPLTALEIKLIKIPGFSLEVMNSAFYKSLKIYGNLPVIADSLGRANPFIPY